MFYDLGSPENMDPASKPIMNVEQYVKGVHFSVPEVVAELAVTNSVIDVTGEIDARVAGRHGQELVEEAFVEAGLCDRVYLEQYHIAA